MCALMTVTNGHNLTVIAELLQLFSLWSVGNSQVLQVGMGDD